MKIITEYFGGDIIMTVNASTMEPELDNNGNPIKEKGTIKLKKVEFTEYTVELPCGVITVVRSNEHKFRIM